MFLFYSDIVNKKKKKTAFTPKTSIRNSTGHWNVFITKYLYLGPSGRVKKKIEILSQMPN